jgi:hypothetical protein
MGNKRAPDRTMSALIDVAMEGEDTGCFELTFTQRMLGFAATALLGLFSGVLSLVAISLLRIRKFGVLFAIFNCNVSISCLFLAQNT